MRAFVFPDGALAKHAGRFVWLSIDTERPENAGFLARHPVEVWPTLMVIDPAAEVAVLRWPGSATVAQLGAIFDDGEAALRRDGPKPGVTDPFAARMALADRLAGEGKRREALVEWLGLLPRAPTARRLRLVEQIVVNSDLEHDFDTCARTAASEAWTLPHGPSWAGLVASGLGCAQNMAAGPERDALLTRLDPWAVAALALHGLLADDRSSLYQTLCERRAAQGDAAGARALAGTWLRFVQEQQAAATSAEGRAAFDPHLVAAAIAAGDPARAIPALRRSEHDLPKDYNAPARLALIFLEQGKLDEARAANDRALGLVYGPRRARLLDTRATIFARRGDSAAARAALEQELALVEGGPHGAERAAALRERIGKLAAKPAAPAAK